MTKAVNYTPEMTKTVVDSYTANPSADTIAALAKQFGKTTKSIVAKLVREGAYKAKETTKAKKVAKSALAAELLKNINLELDPKLLEPLTVDTLKALIEATEPVEG